MKNLIPTFIIAIVVLASGCDPADDAGPDIAAESESETSEAGPDLPSTPGVSFAEPPAPEQVNACICVDAWGVSFKEFCGPNVSCADCCFENGGRQDHTKLEVPGNQEPGEPPAPGDPPTP